MVKQPRANIMVCTCSMCVSVGSLKIKEALERELKRHNLQEEVAIVPVGSSWLCTRGPTLTVEPDNIVYHSLKEKDIPGLVEEHLLKGRPVSSLMYISPVEKKPVPLLMDIPFYRKQKLIALSNRGMIDPESLEEYIAREGYRALLKALQTMKPAEVIEEIRASGLRGRGGAGFPTGVKWKGATKSDNYPRFLICNADEGDPGAFMDRSIIEADPHCIIEGMLIAGYAISAERGYVYIRMEYPLAIKRLVLALQQAREYGLLGENILETGFSFDIEIFTGAGAFVCGESTALVKSIEGKPPEPRQKPPRTALWGKPTVLNNVETFANVPRIINYGASWFASIGTEKSKGTKVFSIAGKINNAGLVEVPMGITLREIIFDIGGGIPDGKLFKAVQIGGPAGGFIPESLLDLPVDYESLQESGAIMGSGGMVVIDEHNCIVDMAKYFADFLRDESCGKCASCREGTQVMYDLLVKICKGEGREEDVSALEELGEVVVDSSQCGLGKSAPMPVLTAIRHFRDEFLAHIRDRKCPAGVCKSLIAYSVNGERCTGCTLCVKNCPGEAVSGESKKPHTIDGTRCIKCGVCREVCNFDAITVT